MRGSCDLRDGAEHQLPTWAVVVSFSRRMTHLLQVWSRGDPPKVDALVLDVDSTPGKERPIRGELSSLEQRDNDGIPVYTIGIAVSTEFTGAGEDGVADNVVPWCKIDVVAEAGGKPKNQAPGMSCPETTDAEDFHAVNNQIQLSAALDLVLAEVRGCAVTLNPAPESPDLLEIDGAKVPRATDCEAENGWVYANPDGPYTTVDRVAADAPNSRLRSSCSQRAWRDRHIPVDQRYPWPRQSRRNPGRARAAV